MKIIKTIFLAIITVFVVFTLGARLFGVKTSTPTSSSMHPAIPAYSLVYVKKIKNEADFAKLNEGDVIEFNLGNTLVIHRISKIEGNKIVTKGDHNSNEDFDGKFREIKDLGVTGLVLFSIPYLGIFSTMYPWIILLLIIAMYYGFKYVIKELKKK